MGNLASLPSMLTDLSDWADTQGAERRVGLVHAALNITALTLFTSSWFSRTQRHQRAGFVTAALGMAAVSAGAGSVGTWPTPEV